MPVLADVLPSPTGVVDYLYLGPLGIAVGALLLVGAVWVARTMRKRGRGRGVAIAAAVLGERLGMLDLAGVAVIAAGILAVQLSKQV